MSKLEFVFERPLFLLLAIPAFLVILLPFFRLSAQRRKGFRKIAPVALHLVAVTLLLLVIAGFSVVNSTPEKAVMLLWTFLTVRKPYKRRSRVAPPS